MQSLSFNKLLITDHNAEGFDSVDSEDFDPGNGCVPVEVEQPIVMPPLPHRALTDNEKWAYHYQQLTYEQIVAQEDEWLLKHGIV